MFACCTSLRQQKKANDNVSSHPIMTQPIGNPSGKQSPEDFTDIY